MYDPTVTDAMNMVVDYEIPGGDDFQDVTELFAEAAAGMWIKYFDGKLKSC
jgi:hypothetical protein